MAYVLDRENQEGKVGQVYETQKRIHLIWDFSYLYYKYYFIKRAGRMPSLTTAVEKNGTVVQKDMTIIYGCVKEIEKERTRLARAGFDVITTVCFDMPSKRNEEENGTDYKAGRTKTLDEDDFVDMRFIYDMLTEVGYNCYRLEGYEADDLVTAVCQRYKDRFDATFIYTPDKDLCINISENVAVMRYKSGKSYTVIKKDNYTDVLSEEFGCTIPYNAILLFLATVGDKSDNVKGINKFGPKAFDKLMGNIYSKLTDIEYERLNELEYLDSVVKRIVDPDNELLTLEQAEQMLNAYRLVRPIQISEDFLNEKPLKFEVDPMMKIAVYTKYRFNSLITD